MAIFLGPVSRDLIRAGNPSDLERLLHATIGALDPAHSAYLLQVSLAKGMIAHRLRTERARAMLKTTDSEAGRVPAWMLSAHAFTAEWIRWTSCLNAVVAAAQMTQDHAIPRGRLEIQRQAGGRLTTLRGGIYAGTISGVIDLNGQLTGHYVDEPAPKIVIARSALPDTVLDSVGEWAGRSNRGRRLGDIIDHPFIAAYDPLIASVANANGAVEIALEPGYSTLAPVPMAAMRMVPGDADPGRPWELTRREVETLRAWKPPTSLTSP